VPGGAGLRPRPERAPGLLAGEDVELPDSVEVGGHVVIHAGTVIAADARIGDGAVIGKPVTLGARSTASRADPGPARLGAGASVGAHAVVLAGASLGERAVVGDQAHVRERSGVGEDALIGRGSSVENDVVIGARVRIQTNCYVTAYSRVEDDVFVGPGVVTLNDHTMGRHGRGEALAGVVLRRACRVGGRATLLPGVEIGEEAFVAAGSLVTRPVHPRALVMGAPARVVREVPDGDLIGQWGKVSR
jgi:UDP-2-acetamido-3-amino-2,3-dideoxy-glucuronate N-acetyltransferase